MADGPLPRLDALPAIEAAVWQGLAEAARSRGHPWRLMAVCTSDLDGGPDARSVVLREVEAERRVLLFYSDARAGKVAQAAADPRAVLLLWWPERGWQLRLRARLEVETSGLAVSSRWARLKMSPAAQDYLSPLPPGSADPGAQPAHPAHVAHPAPVRDSRTHFAVVSATVASVDWLELHPAGHRRARFDAQGARWLVP